MSYRQSCGSRLGITLHAEAGEPPCGTCLAADDARALGHEARQPLPVQPSGPVVDLQRVIAILAEALAEHDRASYRKRRNAATDPVHKPSTSSAQDYAQDRSPATAMSCKASRMDETRPGEAA